MYPILDLAKHTKTTLDIDYTVAAAVLRNSGGTTMSAEDTKIAIDSLIFICKRQQSLIDELVGAVNELRTPKPKFWHRKK